MEQRKFYAIHAKKYCRSLRAIVRHLFHQFAQTVSEHKHIIGHIYVANASMGPGCDIWFCGVQSQSCLHLLHSFSQIPSLLFGLMVTGRSDASGLVMFSMDMLCIVLSCLVIQIVLSRMSDFSDLGMSQTVYVHMLFSAHIFSFIVVPVLNETPFFILSSYISRRNLIE